MNEAEYRAELEKLNAIIASIRYLSATVDLDGYRAFLELAEIPGGTATDCIKRCDALIQGVSAIIMTCDSPLEQNQNIDTNEISRVRVVMDKVADYYNQLKENTTPSLSGPSDKFVGAICSKYEVNSDPNELDNYSFVGLTSLGRKLVTCAGTIVRGDIFEIIETRNDCDDEIVRTAMACRDMGDLLSGYQILDRLAKKRIHSIHPYLYVISLFYNPDIRNVPYQRYPNHILERVFQSHSSTQFDENTYAKLLDFTDEEILMAFITSLGISEQKGRHVNDPHMVALTVRYLELALPCVRCRKDLVLFLRFLPAVILKRRDYFGSLLDLVSKVVFANLGTVDALFVNLMLEKYADAISMINSHPESLITLGTVLEHIESEYGTEASTLNEEYPRFAIRFRCLNAMLKVDCHLVEEFCLLRANQEIIYSDKDSIIAALLANPRQAHVFDLLSIDWWKYSSGIVSKILDNWSAAILGDSDSLHTAELLVHQLERCPEHALVYKKCAQALEKRTDLMSHEFRLAMAKSAVERGNSQYACTMLDGWIMKDLWSTNDRMYMFGGSPDLWRELFRTAKNAKRDGAEVLRCMAKCLPESSFGENIIWDNAYAINAIACSLEFDDASAYSIVERGIAKMGAIQGASIPVLFMMGYVYSYKAGYMTDALRIADQIINISGSSEKSLKGSGIGQLLHYDDVGMVSLLIAKCAGLEDEIALAQHQSINQMIEAIQGTSCTFSEYMHRTGQKHEELGSKLVMHYMGRKYNERINHIQQESSSIIALRNFYEQDGSTLFKLRLRMAIASVTIEAASMSQTYTPTQLWLFKDMNDWLHQQHGELLVQKQREADEARIAERDQVIADLSHHIKNLVAKVLDPLQLLQSQIGDKQMGITIQRALRGGALIREIVNAMNLSYRGNAEDYKQDAMLAPAGAQSVEALFVHALVSALSNMFDGKYFKRFLDAYFPDTNTFSDAKSAFDLMTQQECVSLKNIVHFTETYMCDLDLDIADMSELYLRDKNGSQVKMLIVLNEMLLNAIKYTAEQGRGKRFVRFGFHRLDNICTIQVENSCKIRKLASTTGLGHVVLENFAKNMGGGCETSTQDGIHRLMFTFADFWKGVS